MAKGLVAEARITVKADTNRVWQALTDPAQIKEYLFGTEAISDWKVGSPITYKGVWEGKEYEDKGTILEMVPGEKMVSTYWSGNSGKADLPENYVTVTYALQGHGGETEVVILQDGNDTEAARDGSAANWAMVLGGLKKLVEG